MEIIFMAIVGVLWGLEAEMARRKVLKLTAKIAALEDELEAAGAVLHAQAHAIYQMAVQIHGQAAADRAIRQARERGTN